MDSCELLRNVQVHTLYYLIHHGLTVEHRKLLDYLHVVDILSEQLALTVCKMSEIPALPARFRKACS